MGDTDAFIDEKENLHVNYYSYHLIIPKAVMRAMIEEQKLKDRRDKLNEIRRGWKKYPAPGSG